MTRHDRIAVVMTALIVAFLVYSVYQDEKIANDQLFEDELAALLTQLLIA
jgi:hypothetical protein